LKPIKFYGFAKLCNDKDSLTTLFIALRDRSPVIRKLHAQTIGYLAPVASDDALEKIIVKMKQWYLEKEGEVSV